MIDFSNCKKLLKGYGGANGNKIAILYEDREYMLKFPPPNKGNSLTSYINSCISEHIACQIYSSLGFNVQKTMLGTFINQKGKEYIVVACEDFTQDGEVFFDFASIKNTCIESSKSGYGVELSSIISAINEQDFFDYTKLTEFFWDMFIADALLGNFDRHNGNWGFLVDNKAQKARLAPIYDCGSCLYPQMPVSMMQNVIDSQDEIEQRIYVYPNSIIKENGKKINYFNFISSFENDDCTNALTRIYPKINMNEIYTTLDNAAILPIQKEFYKTIITARKERILDFCVNQLKKR